MYRVNAGLAALIFWLAMPQSPAQTQSAATRNARPRRTEVQVLSSSQMQKRDAELLASHGPEVARVAELYGYNLDQGTWIRNQVVCGDAPNYLLMHYVKLAQDGAVSLFTAIIPRERGPVRVIPVLYHGAQAFRTFGSSPEQRDLINQVVPAKALGQHPDTGADWSSLALCYAALAGAEPSSASITSPEVTTPTVSTSRDGRIREMRFSVLGPDHLLQDWKVVFDRDARVKLIAMSAHSVRAPQQVPPTALKPHPVQGPE